MVTSKAIRVRGVVALFCFALAVTGCTRVAAPTVGGVASVHPWTHRGRLVIAETQDTKSLNPMLAANVVNGDISMFVFSYAVRYDDKARPVPDALREIPTVANGDVSPDGLTLKYKLRKNILWQDGVPLTCRDLAFTWRAVMNPANNVVTTDGYDDIASVDCRDPYVAVVHMKKIYAPFLQQLWGVNGNAPILPAHLLEKYNDAKGTFNTLPYQSKPIGSGPFRVVSWTRGSDVRLVAFKRYFLGPPRLREVVFRTLPDATTLVNELRTHEIDLGVHVDRTLWPQLQGIPGVTVIAPPIFTYTHIDFNLRRPLFADVRVRRALAMGIDRPEIVRKLAFGLGDLTDTAQSPRLSWAYTADTMHYRYDPQKARALLEAAGWKVGPDGIRVRDGVRLAFNLQTQTEFGYGRAMEPILQSAWRALGADVSVKNAPTAQFFDNTSDGILQGGHYDVAIFSWSGAADPDDAAIYSGHFFAPHGQNALFWNDPVATKAMDDELSTVDPKKRLAAFRVEQQRFAADVPSIVTDFWRDPTAYNVDLHGFTVSPVISDFWDPWEYSI